jgi:hypothetical protein
MCATVVALPLAAQEPSPGKPTDALNAPAKTQTYDPSRRVPPFFGQVGLTPEQKEAIYKIRGKYQVRIDALSKQIAETQSQMLAECEAQLNETQKQLLTFRRDAAARAKKERAAATKPTAEPKPAEKPAN